MKEYAAFDAMGLAELVRTGEVSSKELLDEAVSRARAAQEQLNCFSALYPDMAETQLADVPKDGPFAGVPFLTKDLGVALKGAPLTNGSVSWKGHVAERDSVLTERYRKAGLVMFGQTTSPEFGLTTTTESTLYGQTRNPWDVTRTSGGSSGGASAAVAAGVVPLAQASDGGGSIRIPASCTGLFGMKPSRGRTPMGPLQTENWNGMSTVHAVSQTVRDNAALLDASHGRETGSRYVAPAPEGTYLNAVSRDPKKLKIALWRTAPNGTEMSAEAKEGAEATARLLEELGHEVVEAAPSLDGEALGKAALFTISANVAAAIDARAAMLGRDVREDELEPITFAMAGLGRTVPMVELARANNLFNLTAIQFEQFLEDQGIDLILTPTTFRAPDELGVLALTAPPDQMSEAVGSFAPLCPLFNQIGAPAMSVPLHWTDPRETAPQGLPIGMMFGGRCGSEELLFSLAGQLERAKPWIDRCPPVWMG
ncbi:MULTISPECIES: amidase [Hyphomonas]|jgi:amidase/6-aminohexanoate-cyclic-dimer hydrolase|uniref:amidase n=1 Tax=Hyphomonas TaxID=85 RepID=UPI003517F680